jgi:Protein of unknown function (DUF1552)
MRTGVRLSRRTVLRGGAVAVALPFLEAMEEKRAAAAADTPKRFVALFIPNGTDPGQWNPTEGPLSAASLPPCLQDMAGFAVEREWPAMGAFFSDVTMVTKVNHETVSTYIHSPSMSLGAHHDGGTKLPSGPTLDQYLANHIAGTTPYRNLVFSNTKDTAAEQGFISFRDKNQPEDALRDPAKIFDTLFKNLSVPTADLDALRTRRQSVLDWIRDDAKRLQLRLGAVDKTRVDQHLQSVSELEKQIQATSPACTAPAVPAASSDQHTRFKQMIDLGVLALSCDLTRVLVLQYSNSWGLDFKPYNLPDGVADWSDHFISHKLGDRDRATDLDGLPSADAMAIANKRVINTSRFKVRRFGYLINAMKSVTTATGNLLDDSLVLYTSEIGDGDSHGRRDMPFMLAGHAGGFKTGRTVNTKDAPTGAFHCSIINYFGLQLAQYGNPAAGPIAGL